MQLSVAKALVDQAAPVRTRIRLPLRAYFRGLPAPARRAGGGSAGQRPSGNTSPRARLAAIIAQLDDLERGLIQHGRALAPAPVRAAEPTVRAARRLNRASGMLALSVLADSAIEHYRGAFKNPAMYTPLVVSTLSVAVSAHGTGDKRPDAHR